MDRKPNEYTMPDGTHYFAYRWLNGAPDCAGYQLTGRYENSAEYAPLPVQPDGTDNRDVLVEKILAMRRDAPSLGRVYFGTHPCETAYDLMARLQTETVMHLGLGEIPGILKQQRALREPEKPETIMVSRPDGSELRYFGKRSAFRKTLESALASFDTPILVETEESDAT